MYDKFIITGDFNLDETNPLLSEFLYKNNSKNLIRQKLVLKILKTGAILTFLSPTVQHTTAFTKIQQL